MKRHHTFTLGLAASILIVGLVTSSAWGQATPTPPAPNRTVIGSMAEIALYFDFIPQGRAGLLRVAGADVAEAQASVFDERLPFFRLPDDPAWYAFIVAPLNQSIKAYELRINVMNSRKETEQFSLAVNVESGGFIQQDVMLIGDKAYLVDPIIEEGELSRIAALAASVTPDPLWEATGFRLPIEAPLTSPFGAVRVFNGTLNTLHTGWDLQAALGRPLVATAAGSVAFAGTLDIRGDYVLIDHGVGLYSGYAHLSVIFVTEGQPVKAGQIIGLVGSTGRSSNPHAHFEMLAAGKWIDAADFLRMYVPLPLSQ